MTKKSISINKIVKRGLLLLAVSVFGPITIPRTSWASINADQNPKGAKQSFQFNINWGYVDLNTLATREYVSSDPQMWLIRGIYIPYSGRWEEGPYTLPIYPEGFTSVFPAEPNTPGAINHIRYRYPGANQYLVGSSWNWSTCNLGPSVEFNVMPTGYLKIINTTQSPLLLISDNTRPKLTDKQKRTTLKIGGVMVVKTNYAGSLRMLKAEGTNELCAEVYWNKKTYEIQP